MCVPKRVCCNEPVTASICLSRRGWGRHTASEMAHALQSRRVTDSNDGIERH